MLNCRHFTWTWMLASIVALSAHGGQTLQATDQPLDLKDAQGEVAEWLKGFDYEPQTFSYKVISSQAENSLIVYRISFPSPYESPFPENNVVPGELYVPKDSTEKVPAAVVLDILHGNSVLPRMIARRLANDGIAALYISMPYYNSRRPKADAHLRMIDNDPMQTVNALRQTVMDVRRAKAILASRPEVDPDKVGITGVSLGGIMTALAAGVDGTFYRVVPILGGGDIAKLTFTSPETRRVRAALIARGITQGDLALRLAPVEPLNFASRIDPKTCLMVNAEADHTIPRESAEQLAAAIGGPTIIWSPLGHVDSVIYLPNILQKTVEFFKGEPVEGFELGKR